MRFLTVIICFLLCADCGFAQIRQQAGKTEIRYIGPDDLAGSSDAVIVDEVPLAHTRLFSSTDEKGNIIGKDNLNTQFKQIFAALAQSLKAAGSGTEKIIKLNVFLKDPGMMNEVGSLINGRFAKGMKPSVTYVAGDLSHPDALLSIDAVAVSERNSEKVSFVEKNKGFADVAILPKGPVVYVSGQAAKGNLAEATKGTLEQLRETLISLGLTLKDVVQVKSFLSPMSSIDMVKKEFSDFFKTEKVPPLVFVDWISSDPVIEIELIAASPAKTQNAATDRIEFLTPPGMTASPVYSKVTRLNQGKKIYISSIHGKRSESTDAELLEVFSSLNNVLTASGSDFNNLLKATYYIGSDPYSKSLSDLRPRYYDPKRPPAASKAKVKGVGIQDSGVSIDMIATVRE